MKAPLSDNEIDRLQELADLRLPEDLEDGFFDRFTQLAAYIADAPIAMVNFIEYDRQKTQSCFGADFDDLPREESICQYAILEPDYYEVHDLSENERFKNLSYVKKGLQLRYYLGIPIKSPGGYNIGSLCILDNEKRGIDADRLEQLKTLASEISNKLELYANQNEALELARKRNQVVKTLAHDIRNPLSGLINMVGIVREEMTTDPTVKEYLNTIEDSCTNLIEHLDDLSTVHLGHKLLEQKVDQVSLATLRDKIKTLYQSRMLMKNQNLVFSFSGPAPRSDRPVKDIEIGINVSAYIQVVGNLVSNAIKFSDRGSQIELSLIVEPSDRKNNQSAYNLITEVRDYGTGLSGASAEMLFKAQPGSDGTDGEKSNGLGLYLVQSTLQQEGGWIDVDEDVEEGTRFQVTFPILYKSS